uniref:Uncharacterized protein n=1 Tax=Ovis aries TaxID=9940 RepID=A0AC11CVJ0_SHEEP
MVNVLKGVLIECDPAMKQFLLYLDESNALGKKFIIQDIDDTHVFVIAELVNVLQERPALLVKKMWKRTMKHYPKIQFLKAPRIRNNQMEKNSANSFDELLVFPDGSDGKESARNTGDLGSMPGLGRSLGEGNTTNSSPRA